MKRRARHVFRVKNMLTKVKKYIPYFLFIVIVLTTACGGDGVSEEALPDISATPDFTPVADESLADMAINTFLDNGISITVDPEYVDFNDEKGTISQDDELYASFSLTNNSGDTRSFNLKIYSVSTGFSIVDENKENLGSYNYIEVANGETRDFYLKFNAWVFGTQTSYVTMTTDIDGYIQLPMRASVTGPTSFKIIPTGYFCSNSDAPTVSSLDFYKVAYGQTNTLGIKVCNTGGTDIKINSASLDVGDDALQTEAVQGNAFEEFVWQVSDEIDSSFAFGQAPSQTKSFSESQYIDYTGSLDDPTASYDVRVQHTDAVVQNILVEAGKILWLDVLYSPTLSAEAEDGYLYNPVEVNALLKLSTSLGTIRIPLVGATSGSEPMLEMSYRFNGQEAYKPIDLYSDGAAVYFGSVALFLDWVSENSSVVELKIANAGSGSKDLEFYGGALNGFYEYFWETGDEISFPIELTPGQEETFSVRYLPAPTQDLEEGYAATWDFGQFYFEHTGGNGPQGKITLVGEQDAGFAVELFYGGAELEHEYADGRSKNLCVFSTDPENPTMITFKVANNNKLNSMNVNWDISDDGNITATPNSGNVSVDPDSSYSFTVGFVASHGAVGTMVSGQFNVDTEFPETEAVYASQTQDLIARNFSVPFQAMASESGESNLCNTGILGEEGTTRATFVIDRVTMVMTDLIESAHNPPPFRFHLPLEVNAQEGTVRIAEPIELQFNEEELDPLKSVRSFTHQATNIQGCAPLPTNPYNLEYKKGSWTGKGIECSDDGDGTIKYTTPLGESVTIDSDTACTPTNGGEEYIDEDGVRWMVVYHEFTKFDNCDVEYYGKIATFAYRPDVEDVNDVFIRAESAPNESESYYESVYGAYQYGSYITFLDDTKCSGNKYGPSSTQTITDPDEVKDCYKSLASKSDTRRQDGFINECSYFVFTIDEGEVPSDATAENPDYDSWSSFGTYEPHVDDDGETHETKYDMTIYNVHFVAYVLSAGDRGIFFSHPGHLVYSDMYVTITTKRIAEESWYDGDWQQRIAPNTRQHLDKNQIFLKDGERYDTKVYWTEDGVNEEFSNVIDQDSIANAGINDDGYGKGDFRFWGGDSNAKTIIFAGWPINFDEHNLGLLVGIGAFNGKGNTAPSFAKADATTGQGKPLYFSFTGCLIPGEAAANQGCFDFHLDDGAMPDGTPMIDLYSENQVGMLPGGYVDDAGDCANLQDAGFADPDNPDYDVYKYMPCINYKIIDGFDRDRYKNYYDNANKIDYGNDPYGSSTCGYGN